MNGKHLEKLQKYLQPLTLYTKWSKTRRQKFHINLCADLFTLVNTTTNFIYLFFSPKYHIFTPHAF